jgi:hypothetical protein
VCVYVCVCIWVCVGYFDAYL